MNLHPVRTEILVTPLIRQFSSEVITNAIFRPDASVCFKSWTLRRDTLASTARDRERRTRVLYNRNTRNQLAERRDLVPKEIKKKVLYQLRFSSIPVIVNDIELYGHGQSQTFSRPKRGEQFFDGVENRQGRRIVPIASALAVNINAVSAIVRVTTAGPVVVVLLRRHKVNDGSGVVIRFFLIR